MSRQISAIVVALIVVLVGGSLAGTYGGGSGTAEDPYQIGTPEHLIALGQSPEDYDKCFVLTGDIDLSGHQFDRAVIAPDTDDVKYGFQGTAFSGVFNGGGHKILNLGIYGGHCIGLFGEVVSPAVISNLGLEAVDIHGSGSFSYVGGLVGSNSGNISTCYSEGIVTGNEYVGGLVGSTSGSIATSYSKARVIGEGHFEDGIGGLAGYSLGSITASYSTGKVTASNYYVGGLVGSNGGSITASFSTSPVIGNSCVGGLVGLNDFNHGAIPRTGNIVACYSTGTVCGDDSVGGLVGNNRGIITASYSTGSGEADQNIGGLVGWNDGNIITSYSTGTPSGISSVGGFAGYNEGDITASFWDVQTSGQDNSAGGTGLSTVQMQQIDTFLDARWDFVDEIANGTCDYWQISLGDYPLPYYGVGNTPIMPEGFGTAEQPYLIRDIRDLSTVWFEPLAQYRLGASIDLSGITWLMAPVPWFDGYFDGNGYVINNLHIEGSSSLGLFGQLASEGSISNLGLEAVDIQGTGSYVGSLVGDNEGSITGSYSTGTITGDSNVGGLVGLNYGDITASYTTGTCTGNDGVGGFVGLNASYWFGWGGTIRTCFTSCIVTGDSSIGGLVGWNAGSITSSYSTGAVTGDECVGGLVGSNYSSISQSYANGSVIGGDYSYSVGGLMGWNNGDIAACFWDVQTSGQSGSAGGKGLTTEQMKTMSIFQNAGWVDKGWVMNDDVDYPRLSWENTDGVPIPLPQAVFLAGNGTAEDPYLISTAKEFASLSWHSGILDKQIRLTTDLDLSGITLCPIGDLGSFTGVFDGNGHTISNVVINQHGNQYVGLFGRFSGHIQNLHADNIAITGLNYVGGLVGHNCDGSITTSYSSGVVIGVDNVGGLVGCNEFWYWPPWGWSSFPTSSSNGIVRENDYIGDLEDENWGGGEGITNSYSTATVIGNDQVGGLVGANGGIITDSYSSGIVSGNVHVGGLVGCNEFFDAGGFVYICGMITTSYSTGTAKGSSRVGGLVGHNEADITASFWDIQTSGSTDGVGNEEPDPNGVIGLTTAEMQTLSTFTDAGWDFTNETVNGTRDIWRMCVNEMDYPHLTWEFGSDFICPDGVFIEDLLYLSSRWLESSLEAFSSADRTGDGKVNLDDYALLAEQWMSGIELMPSLSYKVGECDTGSVLSAGNPLRFTVKVDGYFIDFEDLIFANCCIEKGICLEMRMEDRVITIIETELSEGICNCVCNYPTTARMGPFEPGTYTIQVDQINYSGYITPIGQMEVVINSDE